MLLISTLRSASDCADANTTSNFLPLESERSVQLPANSRFEVFMTELKEVKDQEKRRLKDNKEFQVST